MDKQLFVNNLLQNSAIEEVYTIPKKGYNIIKCKNGKAPAKYRSFNLVKILEILCTTLTGILCNYYGLYFHTRKIFADKK